MIHGAFIADSFRPLLTQPEMADRYQLVNYRRRGYGGSSRATGPISVSQQAADCCALLDHLGIKRAHVVGHSFGGVVGLQIAMDAPELVHTLALLEPALMVGASAQAYRESLIRGEQRYREVGAAVVVDEFLEARFGAGYRPPLEQMLPGAFDQAVYDAANAFDEELPGLLDWSFGEPEARRTTQPVLAVIGGDSYALSPRFVETYRLLLEWLPNAEGFELQDAAHGLQMQNPGGMARALADFFARHPFSN
jgi:pimeloyl-ACP methyl ester carboxylesterase